jgi:16S rRNA (guanine1207-N2)-methyltransferase
MTIEVLGMSLAFETREGLFSPAHADRGTLAMLTQAEFRPGMRVLDLGCGWGLVGVAAAKICGAENVWMADVDPLAVETARENAARNGIFGAHYCVSDGLSEIDEAGFDLILSNPPYQSDFSVAKGFIEKGFNRLKIGGRMLMVTKREGWYRNKFSAIFGGVRVYKLEGYFVFAAERRRVARGGM